jgi:hypothetical protein
MVGLEGDIESVMNAQSVIIFILSLWTLGLIVCAAIEKFFQETLGTSSNETGALLSGESSGSPSSHGKPKWGDLLRNNIENLVCILENSIFFYPSFIC